MTLKRHVIVWCSCLSGLCSCGLCLSGWLCASRSKHFHIVGEYFVDITLDAVLIVVRTLTYFTLDVQLVAFMHILLGCFSQSAP